MSNKILIGLGVAVAILLAVVFIGKDKFAKRNAVEVAVEQSALRSIIETVNTNGKIYPVKEVKLSVEVPGEVISIFVNEGDSVREGDLLLEINPSTFESSVSRANAAYKQSQANLSTAQARSAQANSQFQILQKDYDRKIDLYDKGVISAFEFEQIEAQYLAAEGEYKAATQNVEASRHQVQSALAGLEEAQQNLDKTRLYAPMSGIVSQLNVELGEKVVGTSQMAGTELISIADLEKMELQVDVGENDVLRISKGDTAEIEVDAYLDKTFKGIVSHIAYSSNLSLDQQITKFQVKIALLPESYADLVNADAGHAYPFRPGMSATADIITNKKSGVLTVPIQSVTLRELDEEDAGQFSEKVQVVFVETDGEAHVMEVSTGIQDDEYIEITSGLEEGVSVVSAPFRAISKELEDGKPIQVMDEEELFDED